MPTTPPGWYPDSQDQSIVRWWDGQQWTSHTQTRVQAPGAPPSGPPSSGIPAGGSFKPSKPKLFGKGYALEEANAEVQRLHAELSRLGAMDIAELGAERERLQRELSGLAQQLATSQADADRRRLEIEAQLGALRQQVVETQETAILQEVGVYRYQHPLDDSVAYRAELARIQDQIKAMVKKDGGAISATTSWHVNGSEAQGRKMVSDISKLMLRAYNAEADNLVRGMKPYKLTSAKDRLDKVASTIARLGASMSIAVSVPYHHLRWRELELTADYLEKVAEEKERRIQPVAATICA